MVGELPESAPRSGNRTRSRWAHANTASNNGTTRRGFCQHDLHRLHMLLATAPTRRKSGRAKAAAMPQREACTERPTSHSGVSPYFDVAMLCTFCKAHSGARRIFATGSLVRGHQTAR
ncbi:hypothetical protein P3T23_006400 [Paraburkholderia sp. GAS448]